MLLRQLVRVQLLQEAALHRMWPGAVHIFCLIVTFLLPRLMSLTPGALGLLDRHRVTLHSSLFSLSVPSTRSLTSPRLKTAISLSTCSQGKVIKQQSGHLCFSRLFGKVTGSAMSCIYLSAGASEGLIVPALSHSCLLSASRSLDAFF